MSVKRFSNCLLTDWLIYLTINVKAKLRAVWDDLSVFFAFLRKDAPKGDVMKKNKKMDYFKDAKLGLIITYLPPSTFFLHIVKKILK